MCDEIITVTIVTIENKWQTVNEYSLYLSNIVSVMIARSIIKIIL